MRPLIAALIVGSTLAVLLALFGTSGTPPDDELARSITQLVEKTR